MRVNMKKEELYEMLSEESLKIIVDNEKRENLKDFLKNYGIEGNISERIFNDIDILDNLDPRITALYTKGIFNNCGLLKLKPENWFTDSEIKEADQFLYHEENNEVLSFPYTFEKVLSNSDNSFTLNLSIREIAMLGINQLTYYNPDIQREGIREVKNGQITQRPKIYQKNVKAIKKLILDGKLVETTLAYNVPLGITGLNNDVYYDEKKMELTINEGARLDIVDGIHRNLGCRNAFSEEPNNPFLDSIKLTVKIFNYDTARAQDYQAQLAKATPIQKSRIKELEKARFADTVVKNLKNDNDSDLKDKISSSDIPNRKTGELTSYNTLSDAVDYYFGDLLTKQFDTIKVTKFLKEFYTYMFGYFEEQSKDNNNTLFSNKTFNGHIMLARYMMDNEIPFEKLEEIINTVNFAKDKMHPALEDFMKIKNNNYKKFTKMYAEVFGINK